MRKLAAATATAGWATASWTVVGFSTEVGRLAIANLLLLTAGAVALLTVPVTGRLKGRLHLPVGSGRHILTVGTLALAVALGAFRSGEGATVYAVQFGLAVLPLAVALRLRADRLLLTRLARTYVVGVAISCLWGVVSVRSPLGYVEGLMLHKNQLAMAIVTALPLVGLLHQRPARLGMYVVLLLTLEQTASRSGVVGALVVVFLITAAWVRRRPVRFLPAIALVGLGLAVLIAGSNVSEGTVSRLAGDDQTTVSNEARTAVYDSGLDQLRSGAWLVGRGYGVDETASHNVLLGAWIAGGMLGLAAFVALFYRPFRLVFQGLRRRRAWPVPFEYRVAIALLGYLGVAMFNNTLWTPLVWCLFALLARAEDTQRAEIDYGSVRRPSADRDADFTATRRDATIEEPAGVVGPGDPACG